MDHHIFIQLLLTRMEIIKLWLLLFLFLITLFYIITSNFHKVEKLLRKVNFTDMCLSLLFLSLVQMSGIIFHIIIKQYRESFSLSKHKKKCQDFNKNHSIQKPTFTPTDQTPRSSRVGRSWPVRKICNEF